MPKKKSDELTPRQRQSREIMREKSAKKKRKALKRRLQIAASALLALGVSGGGFWAWKTDAPGRLAQAATHAVYAATARAGFTVDSLYLEGRNRTPMKEIEAALGVKKGDPILAVSLGEARARLEKIDSVRAAVVERALPGSIYIRIYEREPVAMWQHQGKIALVDDNGAVMAGIEGKDYHNLPLIVGEGAPLHVGELLTILSADRELASRVEAAVRVGDRRWNLRLARGVEVRLPQDNPAQAWKNLSQMQTSRQLLDRDVKVIDLRLEGRLFITLPPEETGEPENARET